MIWPTVNLAAMHQGACEQSRSMETGVFNPGRDVSLAESQPSEWRPANLDGTLWTYTWLYIVGSGHAGRLYHVALPDLFTHVTLSYIKLHNWSKEAIASAASSLSKHDLSTATVYLWLLDTQAFNHEDSGRPLEADFLGRLHCKGKIGVITQWKMQNLWEPAMPILEACKQAVKVLFITVHLLDNTVL
jgi:hypothetical protein